MNVHWLTVYLFDLKLIYSSQRVQKKKSEKIIFEITKWKIVYDKVLNEVETCFELQPDCDSSITT